MMIEKIIKLKNDKYKIIIDGGIIVTSSDVILDNGLLYKKVLTKELYNKIVIESRFYDIYNKTCKYILQKKRSEKQIMLYLDRYNLDTKTKEKIINKLKSVNFINDIDYCSAYINDKINLSNNGINKIKKELLENGVDEYIIHIELNKRDNILFDNKLEKLIIKKINLNNKYSNTYLKNKILIDMLNLGYEKEKINFYIEKFIKSDTIILNNEFKKLCRKYNDVKIIQQKLVSKGFSFSDVNKFIQEKTEE